MQGVRVRSPSDAGGDIHVLGRSKSAAFADRAASPGCFTWQSTEVLPTRLIVACPPFLIRNTVPSFEKRWLVRRRVHFMRNEASNPSMCLPLLFPCAHKPHSLTRAGFSLALTDCYRVVLPVR
jgi:hypothetical protein